MDPTENEIELEADLPGAEEGTAAELDTSGDGAAVDAGAEGAADAADSADLGANAAKSMAEALDAGLDALKAKSDKKGEKPAGDDKDGKTKADDKPADGKPADGKPADAKAKDGEKKSDHVNDPIDERLAPRTQERIRSLVDEVKTLREVSGNNEAMVGAIMNSGATPDEFGAMVGYLHWSHSDDPAQLEQAYKLLQSEMQGIAVRMGKPLPEIDWLSSHPDLVDAVKNGLTTRDLALEMAMGRATTKRTQDLATAKANKTKADSDAVEASKTAATAAVAELDKLGDELRAADPQYGAKYAVLVPKLQAEFKKIPPSQWKAKFLEEYAKLRVAAKPAIVPVAVNKPAKGQPLRPSTPSGGAVKSPSSALDALSSAIDGMRG